MMRIFVASASRETNNETYNRLADDIGLYIADGFHTYVFGGCVSGFMGRIYNVVRKQNECCQIIAPGVEAYKDQIIQLAMKDPEAKCSISPTVNDRKNKIIENSDVLIFIVGGIGTLDELFSCIESKRAGEHDKPILIVNIDGYYDCLLGMLEKIYIEGFASQSNREVYTVCNSFAELKVELDKIANK